MVILPAFSPRVHSSASPDFRSSVTSSESFETVPENVERRQHLGIVTKNYSTLVPRGLQSSTNLDSFNALDISTGEILQPLESASVLPTVRVMRWALKSVVNTILPLSRTSKCMVLRAPVVGVGLSDIEVCKGATHGKSFYQGLLACGCVWTCPVCTAKISQRRRLELQAALASAATKGILVHFVTLTIPHGIGDDIEILNDRLSGALHRMSQGMYSVKSQMKKALPKSVIHGYIRAFEVTHGVNGFHPHYHLLVFTSADVNSDVLHGFYFNSWLRACRLSGLSEPSLEHGCSVEDGGYAHEYISKWGLGNEMTCAHVKTARSNKGVTPWGLLRAILDGDDIEYPPERAAALFQVYVGGFRGRRQLHWSVGLRKLLELSQEISDEALVEAPDDDSAWVLATLDVDQWRAIRHSKQEANVLDVAESTPELVHLFINQICAN